MDCRQPLIDRLREQSPSLPATFVLLALNIGVFVAMLFAGAGLWHAPNDVQLAWGANFGPATEDGQWWRLLSAMFLHFGLLHLAVNMLALVEAGRYVERHYGTTRFLALYFCAGAGGNLLSLATQGGRGISGGASGAVFGLFAAVLLLVWRERGRLDPVEFRWLFWGVAAIAVFNIAFGMLVPGIDNGAHVGGLLCGLLAAGILSPRDGKADAWLRRAAGAALVVGVSLLIALLPEPRYRWRDEMAAREWIQEFVGREADINSRWNALVALGRQDGLSFDELAERIESEVAISYGESFEQLSARQLDSRAPTVRVLVAVREYVRLRHDASYELAGALRENDPARIRAAIAKANAAAGAIGAAGK
jgi:rhomboid protease GluP